MEINLPDGLNLSPSLENISCELKKLIDKKNKKLIILNDLYFLKIYRLCS